jgi:hypothetical protein
MHDHQHEARVVFGNRIWNLWMFFLHARALPDIEIWITSAGSSLNMLLLCLRFGLACGILGRPRADRRHYSGVLKIGIHFKKSRLRLIGRATIYSFPFIMVSYLLSIYRPWKDTS